MKIPDTFADDARVMSIQPLAQKYDIGCMMAGRWRKSLGIKPPAINAINYMQLDSLIRDKRSTRDIMKIMGCSRSPINDRKRARGLARKYNKKSDEDAHVEKRECMVDPKDRLEQYIEKRMRQFHMTRKAVNNWFNTPTGQNILREYPIR
jgi:hypothetical protein